MQLDVVLANVSQNASNITDDMLRQPYTYNGMLAYGVECMIWGIVIGYLIGFFMPKIGKHMSDRYGKKKA